ncbi:YbaB/EbfC family nucleoid-associated protein [Mycobacterium sp. 050134]|uniref:YbaB/EbfC family nucleoid-associated protein n=1 Tax=Mycobacterium sp. 050134 TaxID=3096111 RepID=UPI002ED9C56A
MAAEMHPQVAAALQHAQEFQSAIQDQLHRTETGTFTGTDEAGSVEVVLDGRRWLNGLYIEEGLLRLGAEAVQQRINEALQNADATAAAAVEAEYEQLIASLADITNALRKSLELP